MLEICCTFDGKITTKVSLNLNRINFESRIELELFTEFWTQFYIKGFIKNDSNDEILNKNMTNNDKSTLKQPQPSKYVSNLTIVNLNYGWPGTVTTGSDFDQCLNIKQQDLKYRLENSLNYSILYMKFNYGKSNNLILRNKIK